MPADFDRLAGGDALVMLKKDGSFLVRDDAGDYKPLNRTLCEFRPDELEA